MRSAADPHLHWAWIRCSLCAGNSMAVTKPPKTKTKKKKKTGKRKLESIRTELSAASTFDTDTLDLSSADKIKEVLTAVVRNGERLERWLDIGLEHVVVARGGVVL